MGMSLWSNTNSFGGNKMPAFGPQIIKQDETEGNCARCGQLIASTEDEGTCPDCNQYWVRNSVAENSSLATGPVLRKATEGEQIIERLDTIIGQLKQLGQWCNDMHIRHVLQQVQE